MVQENKSIKDGIGNLFTLRMKDVSAAGDGSLMKPHYHAFSAPIDYGSGGVYANCSRNSLSAGLATNAPIWSFRWPSSTLLAVIRRIKLNADTTTAGFSTAGTMHFDIYRATGFTTNDTGTLISLTNSGKMRSIMPASSAIITVGSPISPGTRTLDPDPLDCFLVAAPASFPTAIAQGSAFFSKGQGEHPVVLAANEGLVLVVTPPAGGVWHCNVTCEWDETQIY